MAEKRYIIKRERERKGEEEEEGEEKGGIDMEGERGERGWGG